jgi:hypothetical protein
MRNYKIVLLILSMLISACELNRAPKCDAEEVKSTAVKIILKKIREQLKNGDSPFINADLQKTAGEKWLQIVGARYPGSIFYNPPSKGIHGWFWTPGYKWTNEFIQFKDQVQDSINNDLINSLKISLQTIRIISKDDNIKKCKCEADVYQENTSVGGITYSAQITEDKIVYVTVYFPS